MTTTMIALALLVALGAAYSVAAARVAHWITDPPKHRKEPTMPAHPDSGDQLDRLRRVRASLVDKAKQLRARRVDNNGHPLPANAPPQVVDLAAPDNGPEAA